MAYIHHLLLHQIPEHIRESYPVFCTFLDHYYRWLSTHGFKSLEQITDIDYVNDVLDLTGRNIRLEIKPYMGSMGRFKVGDIVSISGGAFDDLDKTTIAKVFAVYKENDKTYVSLVGVDTTSIEQGYASITEVDVPVTNGCILTRGTIERTFGEEYDYDYIKHDPERKSTTALYWDWGELKDHPPVNYLNVEYYGSLSVEDGTTTTRVGSNQSDEHPFGDIILFNDLTLSNGGYKVLDGQTVLVNGTLTIEEGGFIEPSEGLVFCRALEYNGSLENLPENLRVLKDGELAPAALFEEFVTKTRPDVLEIDHSTCKMDSYGLLSEAEEVPQNRLLFSDVKYIVNDDTQLDLIGFYIIGGTTQAKAQVVSKDDQGRYIIRYVTADAKFSDGETIYVENGSVNHPQNIHSLCEINYAKYTDLAIVSSVRTVPSVFMDSFISMLDHERIFDPNNDAIALILKNIRSLYLSKGTDEAIKYMVKATTGTDADVVYPWNNVLKPSDGKWTQRYAVQFKTALNSAGEPIGEFPSKDSGIVDMEFSIANSAGTVEVFEFDASQVEKFVLKEATDNTYEEAVYRVFFDLCPPTFLEDKAGNPQTVRIKGIDAKGKEYLVWQGYVVKVPTGIEVIEETRWNNVTSKEETILQDGARWQEGQLLIHGGSLGGIVTESTAYDTIENPYWKRVGELSQSYGYMYRIASPALASLGEEDFTEVDEDTGDGFTQATANINLEYVQINGEIFKDIDFAREGVTDVFKVYFRGDSENGVSPEEAFGEDTDLSDIGAPCTLVFSYDTIVETIVDYQVTKTNIRSARDTDDEAIVLSVSQEYGVSSIERREEERKAPLVAKVMGVSDKTDDLTQALKDAYAETDEDFYNMSSATHGCKNINIISLGEYIDPEADEVFESLPLFTDHTLHFVNLVPKSDGMTDADFIGKTIYTVTEVEGEEGEENYTHKTYATILYCDRKNTFAIHYITPTDSDSVFKEGDEIYISDGLNLEPKESVATVGLTMNTDFMKVKYRLTYGSSAMVEGRWEDESSLLDESTIVLQDSDYYQQFSYDIISTADPTRYESLVDHFHPAGTKRFTTYVLESNLSLKNTLGIRNDFGNHSISLFDIIRVTEFIEKYLLKPIAEYVYAYDDRMTDVEGYARDALVKTFAKILLDDVFITESPVMKEFRRTMDMEYVYPVDSIPLRHVTLVFNTDPKDGVNERNYDIAMVIDSVRSTTPQEEIDGNDEWQVATFGRKVYTLNVGKLLFDIQKPLETEEVKVEDDALLFDRDISFEEPVVVTESVEKVVNSGGNRETIQISKNSDDFTTLVTIPDPTWDYVEDLEEVYPQDGYFEREWIPNTNEHESLWKQASYAELTYSHEVKIENKEAQG